MTFNRKTSAFHRHSACLVQDGVYLATVFSWLWLKLPWHLTAMTAVTKATAALDLGFPSTLLPKEICQAQLDVRVSLVEF